MKRKAMERKMRSLKTTMREDGSTPRRSDPISPIEKDLKIHPAMEEMGETRLELNKLEGQRENNQERSHEVRVGNVRGRSNVTWNGKAGKEMENE